MKLNKTKKILIVGLGLIGGSYAMALKKKGYFVSAITKEQKSIDFALKNNIIDQGYTEVTKNNVGSADIIIFALYPNVFIDWIKEYRELIKKGTIITDVTGVKGCIVYEIQNLLGDRAEFISAHPMAGKEASGVENSDDKIFREANYIVVPTEKNSGEAVELCCELGRTLGFANVSCLTPEKHDSMIAFLSQLTHCIAISLMNASDDPDLVKYTGDSFRDLTRIARINDEMWSELFLANKDSLLTEMDNYREAFEKLYDTVKNSDREGMREMMRVSTARRARFDKK